MITARIIHLATGVLAAANSCQPAIPRQPRFQSVVMVHGIFEDGKAFDTLKRRLEVHGIRCYVPRLRPADGRGGLDKIARSLKSDIDENLGPDRKFALIAFSMGGLVSRHYLQKLGGASRCEMLITVSTPHHGTLAAYTYPTKGVLQMRPGSDFLRELEQSEATLGDIPIVSYRTPMDLIIRPTESSIWPRAENISYKVPLHPLMLHNSAVLDDIERRLVVVE